MRNFPRMRKALSARAAKRGAVALTVSFLMWFAFSFFAPPQLRADVPVIDFAAITQMIQQYAQMAKQLETLYQQVTLLKQQVQSVTGHYGMGSLGKSVDNWQGTNWATISDMVNSGINPGDAAQVQAYKRARNSYMETSPMLAINLQTSNPRMNAVYSRSYQDAVTGMGMGESEFNGVADTVADLQQLQRKIEQTDNLKSAMDLNTAVNVRIAQLSAEQLRMHAAQLRLQAADKGDAASGYAAEAEFFAE